MMMTIMMTTTIFDMPITWMILLPLIQLLPSHTTSAAIETNNEYIKVEDFTSDVSVGKLTSGVNPRVTHETMEEKEAIIKYKPTPNFSCLTARHDVLDHFIGLK